MSKVQSTHEVVLERTKQALALKAEGKTLAEIAKEMGMKSKNSISYYIYTVPKTLQGSDKVVDRIKKHAQRQMVSVLGSPVMNGTSHHDWYVAGWLAAYATAKGLDPKTLMEDASRIIEGKEKS